MNNVINEGFCIGCGNCEIVSPACFKLKENELGAIKAEITASSNTISISDIICPVTSSKNEDYFNEKYEKGSIHYHEEIGHYRKVFAGFVNDEEKRLASSSGGLTTHIIEQLFESKLISGAIVVGLSETDKTRPDYFVAKSATELNQSKKSKYHMVSHGAVIRSILDSNKSERFVFVGVPCSIKAVKLLSEELPELKEKIKYTIAIFCGHQKTHAFTEFVSWQMGVHPAKLKSIDYRAKIKSKDASKYYYKAFSENQIAQDRVDKLKLMDWGLGLFKPKACDFCDDVTGETADIILGDAWHRKYSKDYRGTNLIITRSKEIEDILITSKSKGTISLLEENESFVFSTQGGNFRHRHEGLLSRMDYYKENNQWTPYKLPSRTAKYTKNKKREEYYIERHGISMASHKIFFNAKKTNNLNFFWESLAPMVENYYKKSLSLKQKIRNLVKIIIRK